MIFLKHTVGKHCIIVPKDSPVVSISRRRKAQNEMARLYVGALKSSLSSAHGANPSNTQPIARRFLVGRQEASEANKEKESTVRASRVDAPSRTINYPYRISMSIKN